LLTDFNETKKTLHGLLVSGFVLAGKQSGLIPVVEPRIPFIKPLRPSDYLQATNFKNRWHIRPDIGYYRNGKLDTFVECHTIDMAQQCLKSNETKTKDWITKRDSYLHFVQHTEQKPFGFIICVTLPHDVKRGPPRSDLKGIRDYFRVFKPKWDELRKELKKYIQVRLVILNEDGIHVDDAFYSVPFL
jgi:hypothetical protein